MFAEATEAYDDETLEAFDDENDDEAFDDEAFDDEAGPRRLRFRPRAALRPVRGSAQSPQSQGVDRLVVNTPRGPMTLHLAEKLVREEGLKATASKLESAINHNASRINATQSDIAALSKRVSTEIGGVQKRIKRLKKQQEDSTMLSMMLPLLTQSSGTGGSNSALLLLPMMMMGSSGSGSSSDSMMPLVMLLALKK